MHRVLVVDDDLVLQESVKNALEYHNFQVDVADNGAKAVGAVYREKYDLVVMDVNMPEMDGFATTRGLRNDPATKDIPVVMVTAKDQKADKAWGQMLGAKGYITKPYTDEQVLSVLRAL